MSLEKAPPRHLSRPVEVIGDVRRLPVSALPTFLHHRTILVAKRGTQFQAAAMIDEAMQDGHASK